MKVLLLTEQWAEQGGIQNYLQNIVRHLSANMADKPTRVVEVIEPSARRFFWPFIRPKWLPLFITIYKKVKQARAGREPYQVLFCGKALFEGLAAYYLKKYLGLPYVVFTYALEIETWAAHRGTRRTLQRVLRAADRIIYINDQSKTQLLALGSQEQQLVKIWPGVGEEWFKTAPPDEIKAILTKYKIKQPYILSVGRLVPRKGFDILIESFAALDQVKHGDVQLVIVGQGPELTALQQTSKQHFVQTSVHFLTAVPTNDLRALYAGARLLALTPKHAEGFGIVYLEAAAAGLPALGTEGGGVGEAVLHKQTGLVVAPTTAAITEGLTYLLANEAEGLKMGAAGRKRAWEEFRWTRRILLVKAVLDAVITEQK